MADAGDVPVLAAQGLVKTYQTGRGISRRRLSGPAVAALSFELRSGEILGLVGAHGAGKTTAGALLAGRLEPTSGTLRLLGVDVGQVGRQQRRTVLQAVGFVSTDPPPAVDRRATVGQVLGAAVDDAGSEATGPDRTGPDGTGPDGTGPDGTGPDGTGSGATGPPPTVAELMRALNLPEDLLGTRVRDLTPGQHYLLTVASAVAARLRLVICDEPPEGLTADQRLRVTQLLRSASKTGAGVVLLTSDIAQAQQCSDLVAVLFRGRIVELLTPGELKTRSLHPYTQALLAEAGSDEALPALSDPSLLGGAAPKAVQGGCAYRPWCFRAKPRCAEDEPQLGIPLGSTHQVACHLPELPAVLPRAGASDSGPGAAALPADGSHEPTGRDFAQG